MTVVASQPPHELSLARILGPEAWERILVAFVASVWLAAPVVGFSRVLGLLTTLAFVLAVAGVARPRAGVLGAGMLCTLDALTRVYLLHGGILRWNTFNYFLLVLAIFFAPMVLRWRDPITWLLEWFVAFLIIGLVITPNVSLGVEHVLGIFSVFGLMVYFHRARHDGAAMYWMGLVCGTMSAVGSTIFYVRAALIPHMNTNAYAFFPLTGVLAICLAFPFSGGRRVGRNALLVLAALNLAEIFLSASRGTMLLGVCAAIFLVLSMRGIASRVMMVIVAALVAVGLATQFTDLQQAATHKLLKMSDSEYSESARTDGRSDLAKAALYMFEEHPLGVGTGGFARNWLELPDVPGISRTFHRDREQPAHSAWMKTLAENGVVGMALLVAYVLSFAVAGVRRRDRDLALLGVLTTLVLSTAFLATEFQSKGLWLLVAAVTVLLRESAAPAAERAASLAPPEGEPEPEWERGAAAYRS